MDKNIQGIIDRFCFQPQPSAFKENKTLSYHKKKYIEFTYKTNYQNLQPTINNYFIPKKFEVDIDRRDQQVNSFVQKVNENAWKIKIIPNKPVFIKAYCSIEMDMWKNMKFSITVATMEQEKILRYFINAYTFIEVNEEDFFDFLKKEKNKEMYYKFWTDKERRILQDKVQEKESQRKSFKI